MLKSDASLPPIDVTLRLQLKTASLAVYRC